MDDKRGRLRACTLAGYESALALHVLPRWGELELEAITPEGVQGWIDSFDLPGAAEKAYKTLRQVIRWAIRRLGVRMYDPTAAGVELPHKPAHCPRTMEASQVRAYLRALWGPARRWIWGIRSMPAGDRCCRYRQAPPSCPRGGRTGKADTAFQCLSVPRTSGIQNATRRDIQAGRTSRSPGVSRPLWTL